MQAQASRNFLSFDNQVRRCNKFIISGPCKIDLYAPVVDFFLKLFLLVLLRRLHFELFCLWAEFRWISIAASPFGFGFLSLLDCGRLKMENFEIKAPKMTESETESSIESDAPKAALETLLLSKYVATTNEMVQHMLLLLINFARLRFRSAIRTILEQTFERFQKAIQMRRNQATLSMALYSSLKLISDSLWTSLAVFILSIERTKP